MYDESISNFFLLKMTFCRTEAALYGHSKYNQIRRKLRIWSHLLKKSLMENFIFLCSASCFNYAFWHRKCSTVRNDFDPIKIMKSSFFFFCNVKIFLILFKKFKFCRQMNISEICHLNPMFHKELPPCYLCR